MPFVDAQTAYFEGVLEDETNIVTGENYEGATTLTAIGAHIRDAPTGAAAIITLLIDDVAQAQTVTIADGATTGSTTGLSVAITTLQTIGFRITQIGTTNAGAGLTVWWHHQPG